VCIKKLFKVGPCVLRKHPWNHCHSSHVGGVVGSAAFQSDDVVNDVAGVGNDVSASAEGLGAPHFVFRISS
jgi:hypothetical protein